MKRILSAVAILATALLPLSAAAAPTPSPSPSLDHVLLPPPSGYTPSTAAPNGRFSIHDYAATWGTRAAEAERTLGQDGFVDAYLMVWINRPAQRGLLELAVAFAGDAGARSWLSFTEASDKADPTYQHGDFMGGIDPYFGEHLVYASHDVGDGFVFVKGNDLFSVGVESPIDDVLNLAVTMAKNLHDSAPDSTIPPALWPENVGAGTPTAAGSPQGADFAFPGLIGFAVVLVVVAVLVVVFVTLVRRSKEAPAIPLTSDGRYWFDGQFWRDAQVEAPPAAKRSPDGRFWWDGAQWRPMP